MFSGFRSRWTRPSPWTCHSAEPVSSTTSAMLGRGPSVISVRSDPSGQYSSTSNQHPPAQPLSMTCTTCAGSAAARRPTASSSGATPRRYSLSTRRLPESTSLTTTTSASAPAASSSRTANRTASSGGRPRVKPPTPTWPGPGRRGPEPPSSRVPPAPAAPSRRVRHHHGRAPRGVCRRRSLGRSPARPPIGTGDSFAARPP